MSDKANPVILRNAEGRRYTTHTAPDGSVYFSPKLCRCCNKEIPQGHVHCWLCAFFGGQRKIR